jgi:hypothetical protein
MLKQHAIVWMPEIDGTLREVLYTHPIHASLANLYRNGYAPIEVALIREEWLSSWTLSVHAATVGTSTFKVSLHQDEVPRWSHFAIVVEGGSIAVFADSIALQPMVRTENLVADLRRGPCVWDPCVAAGSCITGCEGQCFMSTPSSDPTVNVPVTGNFTGVRRCGATSSSSTGRDGDPGNAIDGLGFDGKLTGKHYGTPNSSGWQCTCTPGNAVPAWWQVDLGQQARIDHVDVWTDSGPYFRDPAPSIVISDTPNFQANDARPCGQMDLHGHINNIWTVACENGPISGRFVTVHRPRKWLTICEAAVWGIPSRGTLRTFRGVGELAPSALSLVLAPYAKLTVSVVPLPCCRSMIKRLPSTTCNAFTRADGDSYRTVGWSNQLQVTAAGAHLPAAQA